MRMANTFAHARAKVVSLSGALRRRPERLGKRLTLGLISASMKAVSARFIARFQQARGQVRRGPEKLGFGSLGTAKAWSDKLRSLKGPVFASATGSTDRPEAETCLKALLKAMDWKGSETDLIEAAPHMRAQANITDLRTTLVHLGFITHRERANPAKIDSRLFPCLFTFASSGKICVLLGLFEGNVFSFIDGCQRVLTVEERTAAGMAFFLSPVASDRDSSTQGSWSFGLMRRFKPLLVQLLGISFFGSLIALATPIFVMVVYDRVIGHAELRALPMLVVGIGLALGADFALRRLKTRLVGRIAGRADFLMALKALSKILRLPLHYTERPAVGAQIGRLKEFERLRDFFTGAAVNAIIELPFIFLIVGTIAVIAGWLVVAPILGIVGFVGLAALNFYWTFHLEQECGAAASERQRLVAETAENKEALLREASDDTWLHRFRLTSSKATGLSRRLENRIAIVDALSHLWLNIVGLAVMAFGALAVLSHGLSTGALIASMALTWRLLSPVQSLVQTISRMVKMRRSVEQLDQLLRIPDEVTTETPKLVRAARSGALSFSHVSFRYSPETDPALRNVSFNLKQGAMLAVTGRNGSGKSSILKLMQGLYQPQGGNITLDGVDIRQVPTQALRRMFAIVPQQTSFFYGTIAQNLRLVAPLASDDQLRDALARVGLENKINALPRGLETRLGDMRTASLPQGFLRLLAIARAVLHEAPVLLLNEPEQTLDENADQAVLRLLQELKGERTIVLVSHRPSYIRLADQAIFLTRGAVEYAGAPNGAISMLLSATENGVAA